MSTMTNNGPKRPSLSDQIDRLDRVLDGLADGLNDAVASAVRDAVVVAVREAVTAVLSELQTNTELRTRVVGTIPLAAQEMIAPAKAEPVRPAKSWFGRMWDRACHTVAWAWTGVSDTAVSVANLAAGLMGRAAFAVVGLAWTAWNHRLLVGLALGAGVAGGALWCIGGPYLAAGWMALTSTGALLAAKVVGLWGRLGRPARIVG